jgi:hypothetical protein
MSDEVQKTEAIYLWDCLHDGTLEKLRSDLMARTLTIVVDSPYHWEFHKLPSDTRFHIVGENVRVTETFDFEPWLGATEPTRDLPWKEAQEHRRQDYEKGRFISSDWNDFVAALETDENLEIMEAELITSQPLAVLKLGVCSYPNSNYYTVKVHAERFRFQVGDCELSLEDFQNFGAKYWQAFAARSKTQDTPIEPSGSE